MPRHRSIPFEKYNFVLRKVGNSYSALCLVCGRNLKNTAAKRVMAHRNICRETNTKLVGSRESATSESDTLLSSLVDPLATNPAESLSKTIMRNRGDVWKFFYYDPETKHVSCKYCDKKYKKNATRMQEHLNMCTKFQTSEEKMDFSIRHREKRSDIGHYLKSYDDNDNSAGEDTGVESQLISLEHTYNSVVSNKSLDYPIKRKWESDNCDDRLETCTKKEKRDEFDTFGEYVANELRKIKENAVLLANTKHELNDVLHKAILESLKNEEYVSVVVRS